MTHEVGLPDRPSAMLGRSLTGCRSRRAAVGAGPVLTLVPGRTSRSRRDAAGLAELGGQPAAQRTEDAGASNGRPVSATYISWAAACRSPARPQAGRVAGQRLPVPAQPSEARDHATSGRPAAGVAGTAGTWPRAGCAVRSAGGGCGGLRRNRGTVQVHDPARAVAWYRPGRR